VSGGLSMPVQYGTLTAWAGKARSATPMSAIPRCWEASAPGRARSPHRWARLPPPPGADGHGPWRLAAAWGGQFGSATSAENFSLEGQYVR
jgi:hypothetical protein